MPKEGLIGFFDILGYQNIMDNNQINEVAIIVSDTLDKLPDETRKITFDLFKPEGDDKVSKIAENIVNNIKTLLVSDSIIVSLDIDAVPPSLSTDGLLKLQDADPTLYLALKIISWLLFLTYVSVFLRKAFDDGLPVRGAIDTGSYFIKEYRFAGKPIIESFRLAGSCSVSKESGQMKG